MQAGLGGGSSDAAAVLRAAMGGAFGSPPPLDWLTVARALGSDVPFFLAGTGALVEGTGERVTPLGALPPWHALVRQASRRHFDRRRIRALDRTERRSRARNDSVSIEMITALQRADFEAVEALLHNDFQAAIAPASPAVAAALDALRAARRDQRAARGIGLVRVRAGSNARRSRSDSRSGCRLPAEYRTFVTAFAATPDWRA